MIDGGHCGRGRGEGRTEEERRRQQWVLVVVKFGVLRYIYEVQYMKICGALGNTGLPFEVLSWSPQLYIDIIYGNLLNNMWF